MYTYIYKCDCLKFDKVCHYSLIIAYYVGISSVPKYIIMDIIFDGVLDLDKRKFDFFFHLK